MAERKAEACRDAQEAHLKQQQQPEEEEPNDDDHDLDFPSAESSSHDDPIQQRVSSVMKQKQQLSALVDTDE
jgi:hypothetical protein